MSLNSGRGEVGRSYSWRKRSQNVTKKKSVKELLVWEG